MRVIVACAGSQAKWGGYLGVPSHLAPVGDGETLLDRTLRQVRTHWSAEGWDVHVTVPPGVDGYDRPGVVTHHLGQAVNEFRSTRPLWSSTGRTVLLLGDVCWTDAALATVLDHQAHEFVAFGRKAGSAVTGCSYGEIFANSWWPEDVDEIDAALDALDAGQLGRRGGWELQRVLQGAPERGQAMRRIHKHPITDDHWCEIDDATDDFDRPVDYHRHPLVVAHEVV